jgi:hypothetical protein
MWSIESFGRENKVGWLERKDREGWARGRADGGSDEIFIVRAHNSSLSIAGPFVARTTFIVEGHIDMGEGEMMVNGEQRTRNMMQYRERHGNNDSRPWQDIMYRPVGYKQGLEKIWYWKRSWWSTKTG